MSKTYTLKLQFSGDDGLLEKTVANWLEEEVSDKNSFEIKNRLLAKIYLGVVVEKKELVDFILNEENFQNRIHKSINESVQVEKPFVQEVYEPKVKTSVENNIDVDVDTKSSKSSIPVNKEKIPIETKKEKPLPNSNPVDKKIKPTITASVVNRESVDEVEDDEGIDEFYNNNYDEFNDDSYDNYETDDKSSDTSILSKEELFKRKMKSINF